MYTLINNSRLFNYALVTTLLVTTLLFSRAASTETGTAKYLRDHDDAMAQAKDTKKPVFAFFQEVPG